MSPGSLDQLDRQQRTLIGVQVGIGGCADHCLCRYAGWPEKYSLPNLYCNRTIDDVAYFLAYAALQRQDFLSSRKRLMIQCDLEGLQRPLLGVAVIMSTLWLCLRLICLARLPTKVLLQKLGMAPPLKPRPVIEQLSDTQAVICWDCDEKKTAIKTILELNGVRIDVEKGQNYTTLENLQPGALYTAKVYAIGSNDCTNYGIIKFRTLESIGDRAQSLLMQANTGPTAREQETLLNGLQNETKEVQEQQNKLNAAFETEYGELKERLSKLTEEKRNAEQVRAQQRSEVKNLEETKRALELAKDKAKSRYTSIQAVFNEQHSTQNRWTTEIENWQKTKDQLGKIKEEMGDKLDAEIKELTKRELDLRDEIEARETWVTNQTTTNTAARAGHADFKSRLDQLRKNTDLATGEVPQEILDKVAMDAHDSTLIDFLVADYAQDALQEKQWVGTQQVYEAQYIEAYFEYEEASRKLRDAQAQAQAHAKANVHRASASIASSGSNRSLSSMVSHTHTVGSYSGVYSPTPVSIGSSLALSPANSAQAADYQFDSPALHSWLSPRGSLESSRSSSIFFGPTAPAHQDLPVISQDEEQSDTDTSSETKGPRKKKSFFTLEHNRKSLVRRLSIFPKKDEKKLEDSDESNYLDRSEVI